MAPSWLTIIEATVDDIQWAFTDSQLTLRQLIDFYLNQIETLNPLLHNILEVNLDAQAQADKVD